MKVAGRVQPVAVVRLAENRLPVLKVKKMVVAGIGGMRWTHPGEAGPSAVFQTGFAATELSRYPRSGEFGSNSLPQGIYGHEASVLLIVPERPAVAGRRTQIGRASGRERVCKYV